MPAEPLRVARTMRMSAAALAAAALLMTSGSAQERAARIQPKTTIDFTRMTSIRAPGAKVIENLETKVAAAPASVAEPSASPTPATPEPKAVPEALKSGQLYHVDLASSDEKAIAQQLASLKIIQAQGSALVPLPGVYRQLTTNGAEVQLKPFVVPQRLAYDPGQRKFVGSIKVGVYEISGNPTKKPLTAPVAFQVLGDDDVTAEPEELMVEHSGLPLTRIRMAAGQAAGGLTVLVASSFNPEGVPVLLQLAPSFGLSLTGSFDGLGLEAATVAVAASYLKDPEGQIVQLTVDGPARLEQDQLVLDKNGRASTKLRSVGLGTAVVTADLNGFPLARARTQATMPWPTFAAGLIGGLVGGLIRLLPGLRRNSGRRFTLGLAVAVLVGLLVFALYAVGVYVLPIQPTVRVGAVVVFVVSAMGAYLGSGVLGAAKIPEGP